MIPATKFLNLFVIFIAFHYVGLCFCDTGSIQCIESERAALLTFKDGFNGPTNRFFSWTSDDDCCKWRGVGCDNRTGNIITLNLSATNTSDVLQGKLSNSLAKLPFLRYLDLSLNDFGQIQIPEFIGSMHNLEYLNLSNAKFKGTIPDNLGNISRLQYLDLSGVNNSLRADTLDWLSQLSLLKVLDLSLVDLSSTENWLNEINMLPSLVELHLHACQLHSIPASLPYLNFTALEILDLSYSYLNSEIPKWLFQLGHSLAYVNLGRNQFIGGIPNDFGNMTSLTFLDLSENSLSGPIPTVWARDQPNKVGHSTLRELHLSNNKFDGSLENSLPQLSGLIVLDVASNSLEGVITEDHIQNFSSLRILDLSSNKIWLKLRSNWTPPFQLDVIGLGNVNVGPTFPKWLQSQINFLSINISNAYISDTIPYWFWRISPKAENISLSYNNLSGEVPTLSHMHALRMLDLSENAFTGGMPHFPPTMKTIILAGNMFSGPLSSLCHILSADNAPLGYLDLSRNDLSGPISDCWQNATSLIFINLGDNKLSGTIPGSLGYLRRLRVLRLDNNYMLGGLPSSLSNCTELFVLDLSENLHSGTIPPWIGETLLNLMFLRLARNTFHGTLPLQLCNLKFMLILDLSFNNLSGTIPHCVDNFLTLSGLEAKRSYIYDPYTAYTPDQLLSFQGSVPKLGQIDFGMLNLSINRFSGPLPGELTSLAELVVLNISYNEISGAIPHDIGVMTSLEALDISFNLLSCSIPTSMIDLHELSTLNVSFNNLSGRIPTGYQFDTFDSSSYIANNLCGPPLERDCLSNESYEDQHCNVEAVQEKQDTREEHRDWLDSPYYISVPLGFFAGFWGFWGSLFLSQSWRHAYFRFLESVVDWIYVTVAVGVARFRRKFQNQEIDQ